MGLFDRQKEPIFLKTDSEAEKQLDALRKLRDSGAVKDAGRLSWEIKMTEAGIAGEERIRFELEHSHMPMFVLHDLFLKRENLTAQIDYLIITPYFQFVLECKNLFGDIEINADGDFIRTLTFGRSRRKEGIYSPVTQNRRHLELIRQIRADTKGNFITKALFERNFYDAYRPIIVLANPKTVLNMERAPEEIRKQTLRADQLISHMKSLCDGARNDRMSDKETEELAQFFLRSHCPQNVDYAEKYGQRFLSVPEDAAPDNVPAPQSATATESVICPKCGAPMVRRKATKGKNVGNEFYGCSRFPKCRCILNIE